MDSIKQLSRLLLLVFFSTGFAAKGWPGDFCFSLAENYYEQIYCELEAMGKGRELPDFSDFRRNNESTQALLLKRPAQKVGIQLALPSRAKRDSSQAMAGTKPGGQSPPAASSQASKRTANTALSIPGCLYADSLLQCGGRDYRFTGNRSNDRLASGVLAGDNKMGMPAPPALIAPEVIQPYLQKAYGVYLEKMAEIGLAGSTMHFNKFSYLFYDVADKGVSFNGRFETMFHYLKKDKQTLGVQNTAAPSQLALDACMKVTDAIIACASGARNYLFIHSR